MQQENNHTDNLLRQLENDSLPDLSQVDAHWKSMQQLLIPQPQAINGTNKFFKAPFRLLVVTAVTVTSTFLLYKILSQKKSVTNLPVIESRKDTIPEKSIVITTDTILPVVKATKPVKDTLLKTATVTNAKNATPSVAKQKTNPTAATQLTKPQNTVQQPVLRARVNRPVSADTVKPIKTLPVKRNAIIIQAEKTSPVKTVDTIKATKKTEPLKYDFELVVRDSAQHNKEKPIKRDTVKIIEDQIE